MSTEDHLNDVVENGLGRQPKRVASSSTVTSSGALSETTPLLAHGQRFPRSNWLVHAGLDPYTFTWRSALKTLLLALFIAAVIVLVVVFKVQNHIKDILHYIEDHKDYGIIIYLSVYVVCVWLFLPGSIMSVAAGFLFKPFILACGIIVLGDLVSAIGTFIFGRYIFSDWVSRQVQKRPTFSALNNVIAEEGWKVVVMLRLTPLPFNLVSYFFSVSSIKIFTFLWATVLGVLPGTFNAVWIGSLVKSLSGIDKPKLENKDIVIIAMNFTLVGCCVIALSIIGKRSLRRAIYKLETSKQQLPPRPNEHVTQTSEDIVIAGSHAEEEPMSSLVAGFTQGERVMLIIIGVVAMLTIVVSVPLYFYFHINDAKH